MMLRGHCNSVRRPSQQARRGVRAAAAMVAKTTPAPSPMVVETLRSAQAVCFDVDSTFCADESIDEVAAWLGVGEKVAALTAQAMGGSVDFRSALKMRLDVMNVSKQGIEQFLAEHPHKITAGIPELVTTLRVQGKEVFLVSGGFRQIIHPLAESLGIPIANVFANSIVFKEDGSYAGFDESEFTSSSGGKPAAIRHIKATRGLSSVVMVGDGATDMEARLEGAAELFIGYGGVVERMNIAAKADWYIYDIPSMTNVLKA
ncbi:hypothetical protein FOA52_013396 [Chlamydomonas sp. UWO 241]|nr:hypothetical protein FOA52_013396 [Chlamydomonas sp. UWO 241]